MTKNIEYFNHIEALRNHLNLKTKDTLLLTFLHCKAYEGMVLTLMLEIDTLKKKYILDLQWMCLGLDLFGDTLQESYQYQFDSLELLLDYLQAKYQIKVNDIPVAYKMNADEFPNPLKDMDRKNHFEEAWQRFQLDFKNGKFLDTSLNLIYNSQDYM